MNYRILGRSGVKVSSLGLGTDNFANPTSPKESIEIIDRAIDAGINFIDTANTYDDKVVLMRLLVQEDEGKVALVLKNMMKNN